MGDFAFDLCYNDFIMGDIYFYYSGCYECSTTQRLLADTATQAGYNVILRSQGEYLEPAKAARAKGLNINWGFFGNGRKVSQNIKDFQVTKRKK